uniref:Putative secreted protein n=1 Tax=Ixodes ricinus TaxID=34613 RepID=A0A6B0UI27_IXORI
MSSPCSQTLCPLGCCCSPLLASLPPPLPHSPRPSCPIPRGLRLQERSRAPRRPLSSCLLKTQQEWLLSPATETCSKVFLLEIKSASSINVLSFMGCK